MRMQDYAVFGLQVRSEIELPELFSGAGGSDADVTITIGPVALPAGAAAGLHRIEDALVLWVPQVARYRIREGRTIIVDAEPGVPERNVRLFLLGSAFGALLHQRRLLPLHANAVEIDGKAVAFMGASGEGKSTLAAWFHDHGHQVIADDVCVVAFGGDGQVYALPGLPRLRLWQDALEASGRQSADYARSYVGEDVLNKFDVPLSDHAARDKRPLAAIYLLARGEALAISRVEGIDAAEAIFSHTYRGAFIEAAGAHREHWQSAIQLMRSIPLFRAERPRIVDNFDSEASVLRDHACEVLGANATAGQPT
jgi:hypothetical protein